MCGGFCLDLSSTTDLTCAVYLFPDEDGTFDVLPFFWAPAEGAALRARKDKVPYLDWAKATNQYGPLLRLTDGSATDYDVVRRDINEISKQFTVRQMGIDPWNAQHIAQQLQGDGYEIVAFRQGFGSMSSPSKYLEASIPAGPHTPRESPGAVGSLCRRCHRDEPRRRHQAQQIQEH